jgi:hypothetical protein
MAVMCPDTLATLLALTALWGEGGRNVVKLISELTAVFGIVGFWLPPTDFGAFDGLLSNAESYDG